MNLDLGDPIAHHKRTPVLVTVNIRQTLLTYLGWTFCTPGTLMQSAYWQLQGTL